MTNEIKEILDILKDDTYVPLEDGRDYKLLYKDDDKLLLDYITNLQRQIKIMENYFELIIEIGFDYDGYNKAESLKSLIDELVKLASLGRVANDTEPMYMSLDDEEKHYNILNEEIKGEDNE